MTRRPVKFRPIKNRPVQNRAGRNHPGRGTREVLFEFHQVGRALKIIAIDPVTGIEITMVGDPAYSMDMLKRLAARKLYYVIDKKRQQAAKNLY